jgi:hypothetical protein
MNPSRGQTVVATHPIGSVSIAARGRFLYVGTRTVVEVEEHLERRAHGIAAMCGAGTAPMGPTRDEIPAGRLPVPGFVIASPGALVLLGGVLAVMAGEIEFTSVQGIYSAFWDLKEIATGLGLLFLGISATQKPYRGPLRRRGGLAIAFAAVGGALLALEWVLAEWVGSATDPKPIRLLFAGGYALAALGGLAALVSDHHAPIPPTEEGAGEGPEEGLIG